MAESPEHSISSDSSRRHQFCPHCGTENIQDAENCDHCGERVIAPSVERYQPAELANCAKCSALTLVYAPYCVGCGISLSESKPVPYQVASTDAALRDAAYAPTSRPAEAVRQPAQERVDRWPFPDARPGGRRAGPPWGQRAGRKPRELREVPNDSGSRGAKLPDELRGFNWGAQLIAPVWGLGNRVWIAALLFIPFLLPASFWLPAVAIYLGGGLIFGIRGNELAWRAKKWPSPEHFRRAQRSWMIWGVAVAAMFGISLLMMLARNSPQ